MHVHVQCMHVRGEHYTILHVYIVLDSQSHDISVCAL